MKGVGGNPKSLREYQKKLSCTNDLKLTLHLLHLSQGTLKISIFDTSHNLHFLWSFRGGGYVRFHYCFWMDGTQKFHAIFILHGHRGSAGENLNGQ